MESNKVEQVLSNDLFLSEQDLSFLQVKEKCLQTLKVVYQSRFLDEKMMKLVRQNKGATFHLDVSGHELIGALSALSLIPGKDWGLPYYRDRAFALGLGCTLEEILAAFLAREVSHHSGGRMMPEHFSNRALKIPCQSSVVGSQFLHAVGIAKGMALSDSDEVVYVSAGDGATSQGDFHEALNYSSIHKLSVIFVIQDNGWAISVPAKEQTSGESIIQMAGGYQDLALFEVDGTDYPDAARALEIAVKRGRMRLGPSLIVAKVPRLSPHSSSDDPKKYRQEEDLKKDLLRDPLPRFEKWLLDMELVTSVEIEELKKKVRGAIEEAAKQADARPFPKKETVLDHLFKKGEEIVERKSCPKKVGESIVMMDALNHALDEEMTKDPKVVVFGQDVAHGKGGVFGITRGLTEKHGKDRCFNTPLAESTIIGTALGLSLYGGYKVVAEVQFADYLWTGVNQLFNELATYHYRSNGEWNCPVVIRTPYGGYIQGGPYHSQSIEAFLAHQPGLKVVIPSNAADAKRLLKTAIRDPNPVMFLEHKALYRQRVFCAQIEPAADELLPFGKAKIVKEGSDLTIVCWGMMVVMSYEIAQKLASQGINVEVIDLRTIVPFDFETVLASIKKTAKLLILHEAPLFCGFGAEIAAQVAEKGFSYLDAPMKRVGGKNTCVPYCKELENAVLPQKEEIEEAIIELINY